MAKNRESNIGKAINIEESFLNLIMNDGDITEKTITVKSAKGNEVVFAIDSYTVTVNIDDNFYAGDEYVINEEGIIIREKLSKKESRRGNSPLLGTRFDY